MSVVEFASPGFFRKTVTSPAGAAWQFFSELPVADARESRLQAVGRVVEARVEDTAVASTRMLPALILLFEKRHGRLRPPAADLQGYRDSNDSASHDDEVGTRRTRGSQHEAALCTREPMYIVSSRKILLPGAHTTSAKVFSMRAK